MPRTRQWTFRSPDITNSNKLHTLITRAATQHGIDDDRDHEVGDLQDALGIALRLMTPDQLSAVFVDVREHVADGFPEMAQFDQRKSTAEITLRYNPIEEML